MKTKIRAGILIYLPIFFICLLLIYGGLSWLLILLFLIVIIYRSVFSLGFVRNNIGIKVPIGLLMITFLSIIFRGLVCEMYEIPSKSMEAELFEGDNILMCKLNYGPKLPSSPSEVSWFNMFYAPAALSKTVWWRNTRLRGFSTIKHGDVVVFRSVLPDKMILIKRCAGLPGDRLILEGGKLAINGLFIKPPATVLNTYRVWSRENAEVFAIANKAGFTITKVDNNVYELSANAAVAKVFQLSRFVDSIKIHSTIPEAFPWHPLFKWSATDFGPVLIPFEGMRVDLDAHNYALYRNVINDFEGGNILFKAGRFYTGKKVVTSYVFKQNYYFMLGDNRNSSQDSRFWGFLPEQNIQGKAVCMVYSYTNHFNWRRFLKPL